jgi:hypothetical protein
MPVTRTKSEASQRLSSRLRPESKLEITGETFSNEAVHRFVNDCIVPALVDHFLRARLDLPGPIGREHNEAHV